MLAVGANLGDSAEMPGRGRWCSCPLNIQESLRMIAKVFATSVLVAGLSMGAVVAHAQRQPETFFKSKVGLYDNEIQKIEHGHVVTEVLESGDKKYGILVFGAVHINAKPRTVFVQCALRFVNRESFDDSENRSGIVNRTPVYSLCIDLM
jgi:hypothetical protein